MITRIKELEFGLWSQGHLSAIMMLAGWGAVGYQGALVLEDIESDRIS